MKCLIIFLIAIIGTSLKAHAYLVPNDSNYKTLKEKNFQYILPEGKLEHFNLIKYYSDFITPIYENNFLWQLDERTSIVLASENNQIPNAFAMTTPNNLTVYYSGGVEFLESSATSSWLYVLSTHERAHIYQMNVKQSPSKELKYIFGNSPMVMIPFVPLPIFISPNLFLPTFIVEGNAVLNESRFSSGGRLFSGEARALVSALILDNKADLKYMMNDHIFFPFGNEKYLVGGYFQNYLASIYGAKLVDSFFSYNANRYLNPFYLKTSFAETFYQNYETLYNQFLEDFKNKHKNFKKVTGNEIGFSLSEVYFNYNQDKSKILFSSQSNGKSRRQFHILDKNNLEIKTSETLLKTGKIFEIAKEKYASVGSDYINQTKYLFSLFDEDQNSVDSYEGKYIHDIKNNHISYFLMSKSIDTGELYLDDKFVAKTDSKSLLDDSGNIYYFKQEGLKRTLFKNQERLFSLDGFYAILQDIHTENEIYFTSTTANGAGLFCYCQKTIKKMLDADNISKALKLNNQFLISSYDSDGYHIYLTPASTAELTSDKSYPSTYQYSHLQSDIAPVVPNELHPQDPASFSNYLSPLEMRFSSFTPSIYSDMEEFVWLNQFSFTDPLFWSSLDLGFSFADKIGYNFLNYQYSPYLVSFFASIINETWNTNTILNPRYRTDNHASYGLEYSVFSNAFHTLSTGLVYQNKKLGSKNYDNQKAYFQYTYSESYLLNYLPYRYFKIQPSAYKKDNRLILNFLSEASAYLGADFYISLGYNYYQEKEDTLAFNLNPKEKFKDKLSLLSFAPNLLVEKVEQSQIELRKEIPYSSYFYRWPISIRRMAPYIGYQENKSYDITANFLKETLNFFNIGIEIEALFFHRIPSRIKILNSEMKIQDKKENFWGITFQHGFN